MQAWIHAARWMAGAATLALATTAGAQDTTVPRASGYSDIEKLPDFSGVWNPDWSLLFGEGGRRPADPTLTPAAQAKFDAFRKKQEAEGVDQEAQVQCLPPGMPQIMRMPYPIEFLYTPGRVTIFTETYSQARRIYTDGRPLPEDPDLLFNGSSVGRWDGDTLLVDSIGFTPQIDIAAGIPHGENMRIHERMWLDAPDVLRVETTITDPDVLAAPYVMQTAYRKHTDWEIREYVCAENNRLRSEDGGANIDLGLEEDDPFGPAVEP